MSRARRVWATIGAALAVLPHLVVLAFRVAERLFIVAIVAVILLALYGAGKFENGGWVTILGIAVAVWALTVVMKDERNR